MDLIKKCKDDLIKLNKCKNIKSRKNFIKKVKRCVIDAISEICDNFLRGNIKLKKFKIKLLKKHRKYIEFLKKKNPLHKKKKIIVQKGGFLNVLIPSALFILEKVLSNVKS
jgi:hypothetical protein